MQAFNDMSVEVIKKKSIYRRGEEIEKEKKHERGVHVYQERLSRRVSAVLGRIQIFIREIYPRVSFLLMNMLIAFNVGQVDVSPTGMVEQMVEHPL